MNQKTAKLIRKYAASRNLPVGPLRAYYQDTPRKKRAEILRAMKRAIA